MYKNILLRNNKLKGMFLFVKRSFKMEILLRDTPRYLNLYETFKDAPTKLAFKFLKLFGNLEKERTFYEEKFNKILETYAEQNEDGTLKLTEDKNGVQIRKDSLVECKKAMDELNELTITLPDIKFKLEELEPINLKLDDLALLMPFIDE